MSQAKQRQWSTVEPVSHVENPSWGSYGGMSPKAVDMTWDYVKNSSDFWETLPALVGPTTFRRINALQDQHAVYFVTNRMGRHAKWQTESWLRWRGIANPTVVLSAAKADFARAVGVTHSLEDKAGTAVCVQYISPRTTSYLIRRPYNEFDPAVLGSKVVRVDTVDEFLDQVEVS